MSALSPSASEADGVELKDTQTWVDNPVPTSKAVAQDCHADEF